PNGDLRKPSIPVNLNESFGEEINAFLIDEKELHSYDDLTKVNPVTTKTVLKCLQARYAAELFYTNAGCTVIAVNPFQPVNKLYSNEVMKQYHNAPQPQNCKPHIFTVAEQAYRNVQCQLHPVNQSIIVSGESGAGKIFKGASANERDEWDLPENAQFSWLPNSDKNLEEDCFKITKDAMTHLGIDPSKQSNVFKILSGLLHLGNVSFCDSLDESQPCEVLSNGKVFLYSTSNLLKIPTEHLLDRLCYRTIIAGKQQALKKPCKKAECDSRRDCLAKSIYARIS
ncbi:hypothetical protein AB205_0058920, partial [Aquarana catesbeiana]